MATANTATVANVSDFLRAHAGPRDVVITNYGWEALYFHTGLPQGAKLSPQFPIYEVAKARALPDYVFGASRVRWIVWRRALPAYFREQDCEALLADLTRAGVTTELVATIRETGYENRENVHFRRYADGTYVFPWHQSLADVLIYRVDWESDVESRHQRADALFGDSEYAAAIPEYEYYVARRPRDWTAWTRLSLSLLVTGKPAQAYPARARRLRIFCGNRLTTRCA